MFNTTALPVASTNYLLPVGEKDCERLSAQESLLEPYSLGWIKNYIKPGSVFMDVGCGHGSLTVKTARLVGEEGKVIAVDNSEEQLKVCHEVAAYHAVQNIDYIRESVNNLALTGLQCDVVHCRWLLAHIKNPLEAIEAMLSVLKPGGHLLLEEPGGDEYVFSNGKTPAGFKVWLTAVKIQHQISGTSRSVALDLIRNLPTWQSLEMHSTTPVITSASTFHKSRFRKGAESFEGKIPESIAQRLRNVWEEAIKEERGIKAYTVDPQNFFQEWIASLKEMEEDPSLTIEQRSFYQIAIKKAE